LLSFLSLSSLAAADLILQDAFSVRFPIEPDVVQQLRAQDVRLR
jgi:hypothetical protein